MDWAIAVMERLGYVGVMLIVLVENLFPPIPSELVLPFAGFMTTSGVVNLVGVITAATLGSVLGAIVLYWVGALVGRERIVRFVDKHQRWLTITPNHVHQARGWFERYGFRTVFLCRMVPIMRSLISVPAGLVRMPMTPFILYTFAGSLIWNGLLVGLGALLGASWELVSQWVGYYSDVVIVIGVLVAIALAIRHFRKRGK